MMNNKETQMKTDKDRRNFLQTGSMALLGLAVPSGVSAKPRASESLALLGGAKTVTFPSAKLKALTRCHVTARRTRKRFTG